MIFRLWDSKTKKLGKKQTGLFRNVRTKTKREPVGIDAGQIDLVTFNRHFYPTTDGQLAGRYRVHPGCNVLFNRQFNFPGNVNADRLETNFENGSPPGNVSGLARPVARSFGVIPNLENKPIRAFNELAAIQLAL